MRAELSGYPTRTDIIQLAAWTNFTIGDPRARTRLRRSAPQILPPPRQEP